MEQQFARKQAERLVYTYVRHDFASNYTYLKSTHDDRGYLPDCIFEVLNKCTGI